MYFRKSIFAVLPLVSLFAASVAHAQTYNAAARPQATHVTVSCDPFSAMPAHLSVAQGTRLELKGSIHNTDVQTTFKLVAPNDQLLISDSFFSTPIWTLVWNTSHQAVGTYPLVLWWSRQTQSGGNGDWHRAGQISVEITEAPISTSPIAEALTPSSQNATSMLSSYPPAEAQLLSEEMALAEQQKEIEPQIKRLDEMETQLPAGDAAGREQIQDQRRQLGSPEHLEFMRGQIEYKLKKLDPHIRDADYQRYAAAQSLFMSWYNQLNEMEKQIKALEQANLSAMETQVSRNQPLTRAFFLTQSQSLLAAENQIVYWLNTQPMAAALNEEDAQAFKKALPHKIAQWKARAAAEQFEVDLLQGRRHLETGVEPGMAAQSPEYSNPQSAHYMGQDAGSATFVHSPQIEALDAKAKDEEFAWNFTLGFVSSHYNETRGYVTNYQSKGNWYGPRPGTIDGK